MLARWPLVGRDGELGDLRSLLGSDRGPPGVAVFGEAGVGKTRLVTEVVEAERSAGVSVEWVRATEAARTIPLGSFAHLLGPGDEAQQRDDLLHLALARLHARAGGPRFLLAVDDAHLLDEVSVALLHLAVTQSTGQPGGQRPVRVLASVRTGEPLPPGLASLWKDELLARLDVGPLDRDATEQLALAVLGDGVPTSLLDRIWRLSRGNALFLRELVTAAVERQARAGSDGAPRRGPIVLPEEPQERLRELVEERLRLLAPGRRAVLEGIAVAEQVPLEAAERLAAPGDLEALEARGLIEIVDTTSPNRWPEPDPARTTRPGTRGELGARSVTGDPDITQADASVTADPATLGTDHDDATGSGSGASRATSAAGGPGAAWSADGDGDAGGAATGGASVATVQVAHPLYGEVLAAGLPRLRRRSVLRELVAAVDDMDDIAGFDRLRVATWRLESGVPGDPDQLLGLAREALGRLDHLLAERLALAAGGTSRADAGLIVAEALSGQGRLDDAEAVLAALRPTAPEQVARIAIARASDLFLYLDRSSEAFDVLGMADDDLDGHPAWQAECRSVLAQMYMFSLRLGEAGQIAEALLADAAVPEPARVRAVSVAVSAWGAQGRLDDALALLTDDLHASARRHRRDVPYGDLQLRMARFQTLHWAGRVREADDYTAANLGLELDHPPPSLRGILAGFRGGALLLRGRARAAMAELQRSSRALAENDWFGQRPLAEAMRARAAVFAGAPEVADDALHAADAAYEADPLRGARTLPYIRLSRAWLLASRGAVGDAVQQLLGLGMAMELVAKPLAVEVLHAVVRLGQAAAAVDALERLDATVDGPFAGLAARHARARAGGDADQLTAVAAAFEELGADLLAAEAHRSAHNAYRRSGKGAAAGAAERRAAELLERCGPVSSPGLEPVLPEGEELTNREREVARLAAAGRTSPEIAEALYLSIRTVDTHLHRVYRKLQVEGRHQLAEALGMGVQGRTQPGT